MLVVLRSRLRLRGGSSGGHMGRLRPGTDVLGVDLRAVLAVVGSSFLIDHKLAALAAHRSGPVIALMRVQGIPLAILL